MSVRHALVEVDVELDLVVSLGELEHEVGVAGLALLDRLVEAHLTRDFISAARTNISYALCICMFACVYDWLSVIRLHQAYHNVDMAVIVRAREPEEARDVGVEHLVVV